MLPSNWQVVRRSPCPRVAFVTGTLISVLPPLAVVLVAAVAAAAISGHLGIEALAMPVLIVWLVVLMWGLTLLVTAIGGRFRDAVAVAPVIVQAGIFLTPVGYPLACRRLVRQGPRPQPRLRGDRELALVAARHRTRRLRDRGGARRDRGFALLGWYVFGRMETRFSDYV